MWIWKSGAECAIVAVLLEKGWSDRFGIFSATVSYIIGRYSATGKHVRKTGQGRNHVLRFLVKIGF